ncbi:cholinesterase 2-like isoform X2 [Lineus longissimus]
MKLAFVGLAIGMAVYLAGFHDMGKWYYATNASSISQSDCLSYEICRTSPCVRTLSGCVRGNHLRGWKDTEVNEYAGIPFAAPPVGDLRLADPMEVASWTNLLNATQFRPSCMFTKDTYFPASYWPAEMWNPPGRQSEDCLQLNIWTPGNKNNLTVMVWIFGGGFYNGATTLDVYNGSMLAAANDVVVVSISYRTAVLGFLSTGDGQVKGNFGLEDQLLGLKWIKKNIHKFGGDPESITLFGESAGAASVGYHMLSSKSKGLFSRAILESATPLAPWAFMSQKQAKKRANFYLKRVNCSYSDGARILRCLRTLSVNDLLGGFRDYIVTNTIRFPWVPTVDGSFLEDSPISLIRAGRYNTMADIMIGYNKNEASYWQLYSFYGQLKETRDSNPITLSQFESDVRSITKDLPSSIQTSLIEDYSNGSENNGNLLLEDLDTLEGDRAFKCSVLDFSDSLSNTGGTNVYLYDFQYRASNEVWPQWIGVYHGAEIQWIFGLPLSEEYSQKLLSYGIQNYSEEEKIFSIQVMKKLSEFAKTGQMDSSWPEYTSDTRECMYIGPNRTFSIRTVRQQMVDRCHRWAQYEQQSTCCDLA